jgi:predicted O-methyltransferase YrrM
MTYEFSNDWFDVARKIWDDIIPRVKPARVLEIGSFEGASTCYLIEKIGATRPFELYCVDTWEGGEAHGYKDLASVEKRFDRNVGLAISKAAHPIALHKVKSFSDGALASLLAEGKRGYFDFIYVDGSHRAPDVLCDAVLSFRLLRVGGVIAFDDYLWEDETRKEVDPIGTPKIAIDAFTNIYGRKLRIIRAPLYQLYILKIAD